MWMKMPGITVSGPYLDRLTQPSQIDWNNPSGMDNQIVTWGQNQNAVAVLANVAQGYVCPIDCTFGPIQTDSSGEFVLYVNMYENTSASSASCFTSMFGNLLNTPGMCNGESVFQACFQNGNGPICQMIQGKNSSLTDECISALQTYSTTLQGKTLSETFNYAQGTYAPGWMLQACNTNTQNSYPISTNLLTSSGLSNYTYPYGDPCSSGGGNSTAQNVIYDVLDILSAIVF